MKLVITGSIAYDYLMSFPGRFADHILPDKLHRLSVSFLVDSLRRQRGGIAPNIAYTLAMLGGRPTIMAAAGQDFGDYRNWLESHGIDTSAVVVFEDEFCASFFVSTDQEHNQIASFYTGAMARAAKLRFADLAPDAELAVISPNDPEAMCAYVRECKRLGIPYVYDPSQQTIRLSAEQLCDGLDGCYLLTVNAYELDLIMDKTGLDYPAILERAGAVVLTKGAFGATIAADDELYEIPAVAPQGLVEPTGAGDAFRGGLLRGLELGLGWQTAGRMGALAATYVLENMGTQGHRFTAAEFVARYGEEFGDGEQLDGLLE